MLQKHEKFLIVSTNIINRASDVLSSLAVQIGWLGLLALPRTWEWSREGQTFLLVLLWRQRNRRLRLRRERFPHLPPFFLFTSGFAEEEGEGGSGGAGKNILEIYNIHATFSSKVKEEEKG